MKLNKRECCNHNLKKDITSYLVIMIMGLVISSFFFEGESLIFWAINFSGWIAIFLKYLRFLPIYMASFAICYVVIFALFPVLFNISYLSFSYKSIGTSVGLVVVPLYILLFVNLDNHKSLSSSDIRSLLRLISAIGVILMFFSIVLGFGDYIKIFSGYFNAYSVNVAGILRNKNTYGAILALSTCCDLFLIGTCEKKSKYRWTIFLLKCFGVVTSFSRAALLFLFVCCFCFFVKERKQFKLAWLLCIIILCIFTFLIINNAKLKNLIIEQVIRTDVGGAGRARGRADSFSLFVDNIFSLFFGAGYFGIDYLDIDIDNSYYHVLFSGGIVKCIVYLYWIRYSLKKIILLKAISLPHHNMCFAVFVAYFVYAFFESVPLFELGIITFINMLFIYIIPCTFYNN